MLSTSAWTYEAGHRQLRTRELGWVPGDPILGRSREEQGMRACPSSSLP